MKKARRWAAGGAALIVVGSCNAAGLPTYGARPAEAAPPQTRPPLQLDLGQPVAKPVTPPPAPAPAPVKPVLSGRFLYQGTMIQGGLVLGTVPRGTTVLLFNGQPVPIASDGRFLIGFDRDAGPSATLAATLDTGQTVQDILAVAPRAWNISRLDSLPKFPVPEPEFAKIRPAELAQINASRQIQVTSDGWRQAFMWPAIGRISTLFGSQRIYKNGEAGSYHSGIDIAQPTGTTVLSPADGVVVLAADHPFTLEGNLLIVDHGNGLNSAFMHLSRIDVHVGERVRKGQPIAAVGMTGRATGPHLHWSLKWRDSRVDPLLVAGPMPTAQ